MSTENDEIVEYLLNLGAVVPEEYRGEPFYQEYMEKREKE
jgi:hypothetical protein